MQALVSNIALSYKLPCTEKEGVGMPEFGMPSCRHKDTRVAPIKH